MIIDVSSQVIEVNNKEKLKKSNLRITPFILNIILFIVSSGLICNLYQADDCFLFSLLGCLPILITLFEWKNKKAELIVKFCVLGASIVFALVMLSNVVAGTRYLANDVFETSETFQGYIYDRYDTGNAEPLVARRIAVTAFALIAASAINFIPGKKVRNLVGVGVFVFIALIYSYYGITPNVIWFFLFILMIALMLLNQALGNTGKETFQTGALLAGLTLIITLLTFLIAPNINNRVAELNEQLRDRLAPRTVYITGDSSNSDKDNKDNDDSGDDENDEDDSEEDDTDKENENDLENGQSEGAGGDNSRRLRILFLILIILAISAFIIFLIVKLNKILKKRQENRDGIDSPDNAVAIRSMFLYMMRWFVADGVQESNRSYTECIDNLKEAMPEGYTNEYSEWVELWQKAAYSSHKFSDEQRNAMKSFMDRTTKYLWSKADYKKRFSYKWKYAL